MPKKTKAQKIIADLRRKLATKEKAVLVKDSKPPSQEFIQLKVEKQEQAPQISLSFVLRDLKKSLFLFLLAISFEFMLYYFLENSF